MAKYAKTPKSFINIKDLGFALLKTDEADGTIEYTNITQTRGLQEISVETGGDIVNAYADGGIIESGNTDGEGKISMTMHAFPQEIRELIFNEIYNEKGVYAEQQGKQNNYVAVWFKRERRDGTFQRVGLTKVMFSDPQIEGKSSEENWEFSSEESEGTAMHRVADGKRKIMFDSAKDGADEKEFFKTLLANENGLDQADSDFNKAEDVKVTEIVVEPSSANVEVGSTINLTATVKPDNAKNKNVMFSTADTQKVNVDANTGVVTGLSEGQATVTVSAQDGSGVVGTATVTVNARPEYEETL
ncbi:TPA: Ig-like domain-containing protein [Staphylococcus delphini]|nr:Ig-like domain-containing protein [Staphylococcus delphini]HEC2167387.1 Ig-like domain-containing protein [Staphylococcus delphini]HEC2198080.1 Ig-like domain-containing protein [Staphylococcus delphini]HEC2224210.1 Ig-like domain-containing protein [Staphylococcus delphini]HEC2235320.1 Ig-like domain-containing protein [Staphylococcus delphini]